MPYAQLEAEKFIHSWQMDKKKQNYLTDIGMQSFETAFKVYVKNDHHLLDKKEHFPKYFRWWARQAMAKHFSKNYD